MIFSVGRVVNASVGSLCVTVVQVTVGKMIIRTKNVQEISNVQVPRSHAGLVMVLGIYVFPGRRVATV